MIGGWSGAQYLATLSKNLLYPILLLEFVFLPFYTLKALNNAQLTSQGPSSLTSQYSEYGIV
jgi:hypothetical protein